MTSGFFALMLVRMAEKSVALSVVNSWVTTGRFSVLASFMNSLATPWPKAVRSSITAALLACSTLTA